MVRKLILSEKFQITNIIYNLFYIVLKKSCRVIYFNNHNVKIMHNKRLIMFKILNFLLCFLLTILPLYAETVTGGIEKTGMINTKRIVDAETNMPIEGAKVSLPKDNYTTYTDSDGEFKLDAYINGDTIMSVEKEGYKPYSLTLNKDTAAHPISIGIEKTNGHDMQISTELIHLGDDNFSDNSANAGDFRTKSYGTYITKQFMITHGMLSKTIFLVIGSIVGIDTLMARSMGQNKVINSYSSPPEVFFNGNKIAEIQLNGDGQRIQIPRKLIKPNLMNEITVRTGKNLRQTAYIDYDDIELMNLSITAE